jgi:hypothetical protein
MKPLMTPERCRTIQIQNKLSVCDFSKSLLFQCINFPALKLGDLPRLPFIFAEVLDGKRAYTLHRQKTLARRVNCKSTQVACNPAALQLLSGYSGCPTASKAIEN